jgi:hypothetical protein
MASGLGTALHDAHTPACASLFGFRRLWLVRDAKAAHQEFLRMRRSILAHLVWEEFSLLEPFRGRLPQFEPLRAVTADLESHRELRALLTKISRLLQGRHARSSDGDRRIVDLIDQLEQSLDSHRSAMRDQLCPALEGILSASEQDEVIVSLRGVAPQRAD